MVKNNKGWLIEILKKYEKKSFLSNGPFTFPDGHIPISRTLATP